MSKEFPNIFVPAQPDKPEYESAKLLIRCEFLLLAGEREPDLIYSLFDQCYDLFLKAKGLFDVPEEQLSKDDRNKQIIYTNALGHWCERWSIYSNWYAVHADKVMEDYDTLITSLTHRLKGAFGPGSTPLPLLGPPGGNLSQSEIRREHQRRCWKEAAEEMRDIAFLPVRRTLYSSVPCPDGLRPYDGTGREKYLKRVEEDVRAWIEFKQPSAFPRPQIITSPLRCLGQSEKDSIVKTIKRRAKKYCQSAEKELEKHGFSRGRAQTAIWQHLEWTVARIIQRKDWAEMFPERTFAPESKKREYDKIQKAVKRMLVEDLGLPGTAADWKAP
ncbi:MAG TPA: hypothetical protein VFD58_03410 [Blastocatellia bacterium]|nr:hypothetical protein [Blastocatellia bacterium]